MTPYVGIPVKIIPLEELIWQKSYVMERERFDGADIAHLLLRCGEQIDWEHLLRRFGSDWRVLLSHLVLFSFIYPARRNLIPEEVIEELLRRMISEQRAEAPHLNVCNGTFLSRKQFNSDLELDNFLDGRKQGSGAMTAAQIKEWTDASEAEQKDEGC